MFLNNIDRQELQLSAVQLSERLACFGNYGGPNSGQPLKPYVLWENGGGEGPQLGSPREFFPVWHFRLSHFEKKFNLNTDPFKLDIAILLK